MPYQLSELADDDLAEIIVERAELNARSARRLYGEFLRVLALVAANPGIGHSDSRLPTDLRVKFVEKQRWALLYVVASHDQMVTVLRIVRANTDFAPIFQRGFSDDGA